MKKYIIAAFTFATLLTGSVTFTACEDIDDVKELSLDRLLSPTNLTARVRDKVNIELSWDAMDYATSYTIEVFKENPNFEGTALSTVNTENTTYTLTGLEGETSYNIRVKSTAEGANESKWSTVARLTDTEQILQSVAEDDLKAKEVTLRWPAGQTATEVILTPGDIRHNVTAEEISAGAVTISGLLPETLYTAKLMNESKTRGVITFTTLIDFGDATPVEEGDNLIEILDNAAEGASFIIISGEFDLGSYALTKSVKIAGFKPSSKPTIKGRFTVAGNVASLSLSNIIFDGEKETDNLLELTNVQGNLGVFNIAGCEIRNMSKHIIYNNQKGTFGTININNCIVEGIANNGGDGFDIRGGALTSLSISNTTFSNGIRSLLRCQIASTISFKNCTFYNICTLDDSNNTGLFRMDVAGGQLTVENCLIANVGSASPVNVNSGTWGRKDKIKATESIKDIYYHNSPNLWTNSHATDYGTFAIEGDPGFKDAANGDLTLANDDMIEKKIGDPRWYTK